MYNLWQIQEHKYWPKGGPVPEFVALLGIGTVAVGYFGHYSKINYFVGLATIALSVVSRWRVGYDG